MSWEALELVAARFKVLAEPLRLRILQVLEGGEATVSQVVEAVGSTQPNISKHLKTLLEAGLIARRQEGTTVHYSIADESVFNLCEVVCGSLRRRLDAQSRVFSETSG